MENIINQILKKNNIHEPCVKLKTMGLANDVYATPNFVIRIPTDHPEANPDALTESVAAPLAHSIGIRTPKLICFDNSYQILNKTYSIWERVHGETFGEREDSLSRHDTWREFGLELGKLHSGIHSCHDPNGWLDFPDREYSKKDMMDYLQSTSDRSDYLLNMVKNKHIEATFNYRKCFVHGDTHEYNIMCTPEGDFLSVIDWGDAGWADPGIDFYMVPGAVLGSVLEGYKENANSNIDINFIYRIILDKLWVGIEEKKNSGELESEIIKLENRLLQDF